MGEAIESANESGVAGGAATETTDSGNVSIEEITIYYGTDAHGIALLNATENSDTPLQQFILSCLR